jgi:DNA helicase HerA-like ATPase
MPAVFGQIQRIARRGRKRWLGLAFATQFPQHLPGELFTLCNNRVLMRLGDEPTLRKLQHSVGGVPEGLWPRLKNLPTGQAIVSAHGIDPALIVALDPGRCLLRMVD